MHLVGFTIEIYYDARSYKRQIRHFVLPIQRGFLWWFGFSGNPNQSTYIIFRMAEKLLYLLSLPLDFFRLQFYSFIIVSFPSLFCCNISNIWLRKTQGPLTTVYISHFLPIFIAISFVPLQLLIASNIISLIAMHFNIKSFLSLTKMNRWPAQKGTLTAQGL